MAEKNENKIDPFHIASIVCICIAFGIAAIFLITQIAGNHTTITNTNSSSSSSTTTTSGSKEAILENKLGSTEALSACQIYGERNYRNFKIHMITGKIIERAEDSSTWLFKYSAEADGYEKNMECYVTGTSSNPVVTKFYLY